MKKDRNCNGQYPVYNMGMMGGMPVAPIMPIPNQMPYQPNQMYYPTTNYQTDNDQQNSNVIAQLNNLEKRVSTLEGIINSNNSYNTSNYQMM